MILRAKADSPWRAQREQQLRWRGWSRSLPATMLIGLAARRVPFPTIQIKHLDVLTSDGRFLREKAILLEPANPLFSLKNGDWR